MTESEDMVEKVARAIADAYDCPGGRGEIVNLEAVARAAIAAMREPTEAMVAAGIAQADECTDGGTASAACIPEHAWSAMIDAALTPPAPSSQPLEALKAER